MFSVNTLKAASNFCISKGVVSKSYTNINLYRRKGFLYIISVDGPSMLVQRYIDSEQVESSEFSFHNSLVKDLSSKSYFTISDSKLVIADGINVNVPLEQSTMSFEAICRVIPKNISNEPSDFDFRILDKFEKVSKILTIGRPFLSQNGKTGTSIVNFLKTDNVFGVIVPLRLFKENEERVVINVDDMLMLD